MSQSNADAQSLTKCDTDAQSLTKGDTDAQSLTKGDTDAQSLTKGDYELYSKSGQLLGRCFKQKAKWLIRKQLGQLVDDRIHLLFDSDRTPGDDYRLVTRQYLCVCCGHDDKLNKFRVVPSEFRNYLPIEYKANRHQDSYLLCDQCINDANMCSQILKKTLMTEFKITETNFVDTQKAEIAKLSSKLIAGFFPHAAEKLKDLIGKEATREELEEYVRLDSKIVIDGSHNLYEYIVNTIIKNGQMEAFIDRWRNHFLQTMEPAFLEDHPAQQDHQEDP
jgi:hypothetical protein